MNGNQHFLLEESLNCVSFDNIKFDKLSRFNIRIDRPTSAPANGDVTLADVVRAISDLGRDLHDSIDTLSTNSLFF